MSHTMIYRPTRHHQTTGSPFIAGRLETSLRRVCLSVQTPEGEANDIARRVCQAVTNWLAQKPEVTSGDIRRHAAKQLTVYQPDAAYLYAQENSIL